MSETSTSRTANIAVGFGIAGPGVTMVGIGVSQAGAPPMTGFLLFQLGILCGLVGLILGLVGIFLTRGGVGGRSRAATARSAASPRIASSSAAPEKIRPRESISPWWPR